MDLQDAINHPRINVFDLIPQGKTYTAKTYRKPNESNSAFEVRNNRNQEWSNRLKQKGRS